MSIIDKIKLLLKINSAVNVVKEANVKSGWKTSEFWLVLGSQLVPIILLLWSTIPASVIIWLAGVSGTLAIAYAIIRAYVKATPQTTDDVLFNRIINVLKPILDKIGVATDSIEIPEQK